MMGSTRREADDDEGSTRHEADDDEGSTRREADDDEGSIVLLLAMVLAGFAIAAGLVVAVADHVVDRARAQAAADAAALAAAAEGPDAARRLATLNGARVRSVLQVESAGPVHGRHGARLSPIVVVVVEVDGAIGRAAAARFETRK